jgi:two-component system, chemotaxis family, CheB/CheR fusion protein
MTGFQTSAVSSDHPPICAIGASAGGVRALQDFFAAIDDNLGLAYVVVAHLSPDNPSHLSAILARRTRMSVEQVEHSVELRPNCAYVIAPDRELVIEGDKLVARRITEPRTKRAPIDTFFRSVAAARGGGLAVVLSGTGSDGALGIRAMKQAGSVIFVQDPDEAEYPTMPQSAIATRVVDFIAPVPTLVHRIAEVMRSRSALHQLSEEDAEQGLRKIIHLLLGTTGHDFSHYERTKLMRQVARRMQISRHDSIGSYVHYLRSKPEEVQELLADLLISVTSFFRDRHAFGALARKAIQPIFKKLGENAGVRVWVVGCTTGEGAYSVALMLLEEAARGNFHGPIQIFASDLNEQALAVAREGCYPKAIAADVSQERLRRFFTEDRGHYRIRKEVRRRILFASHNVLKDPPFIRIDLIVCRNLLIHLDRHQQLQLCTVLHYALKSDGYLFLGSADSADTAPELFRPIDRDSRLYMANPTAERAVPIIPPIAPVRVRAFPEHGHPQRIVSEATLANSHLSALERHSPPSALVDAGCRVLHLSPEAGRFIRPSEGPLRTELWELVRPELRLELKHALRSAFDHGRSTVTLPVTVDIEEKRHRIMEYVALTEGEKGSAPQALVLFLDVDLAGPAEGEASADAEQADQKSRLAHELAVTRERYSEASEALAASNEELQSINEEYRSNFEELETRRGELESANEELKTVNAELKVELDNLSSSRNDLQNLIAATEIGALFLDEQLRIKFFTPAIIKHFNITQADLGRVITDFAHRLKYDNVEKDANKVLESLVPMEAEVKSQDNCWLMMRMRPYRALENLIGGVVVTLTDVTELKRVQESLHESETRMRQVLETDTVGVLFLAADGTVIDSNKAFLRMTGYSRAEVDARELSWRKMTPPEWVAVTEEQLSKLEVSGLIGPYEKEYLRKDHSRCWILFAGRRLDDGTIAEYCIDISDRKRAERERELLASELSHRVKNTLAVVEALASQTAAKSVEEFRDKFTGRVQALAQAHTLLFESDWSSVDLKVLLQQALSAYHVDPAERVLFDGDRIALTPKQALGLRLMMHELATNAVKYGALSTKRGTVHIRWQIEQTSHGQCQVRMRWEERGGPVVKAPRQPGFGAKLIKTACEYDLEGEARLEYAPDGLTCEIAFPTAN